MVTPINDETAQRIFKAVEEQSDVLKRMGSRLIKQKKPNSKRPHMWRFMMMKMGKVGMKEIRPIIKGTSNLRSSS